MAMEFWLSVVLRSEITLEMRVSNLQHQQDSECGLSARIFSGNIAEAAIVVRIFARRRLLRIARWWSQNRAARLCARDVSLLGRTNTRPA
jgi:hypothetical protein